MSSTEADTIKDRIARFKEIFRPKTDENHENIEDKENPEDTVDICCGYKFCKTCYPQFEGCLTYEDSLKKEKTFKRPKIKPKKPEKKPRPVKKDYSEILNSEPNNRTLKRENYEKDKIISMMESEIGILYDQIKLMVKYL